MLQALRVLLVEDNRLDAHFVKRALAKAEIRYDIVHADCITVAEQKLDQQDDRPSIVLLDLSLPECHGIETLERIRRKNSQIPVVVLTSLADGAVAHDCLSHGAQDYLVKGQYGRETLERSIRYAIHRQRHARHLAQLAQENMNLAELLKRKNRRLAELYRTAHRFVDDVSHEFRTPLTVIKEFTSILQDELSGPVNDEQRRYLDIIADRVCDLSFMVNDLLDASKLEAGMLGLCRQSCRPAQIIERIGTTVESKAKANKTRIGFDVPEFLPPVFCDPEKIGRVLINLIVNAMKFSPDQSQVDVRVWEDPLRREVVFEVADEGPGIPPEKLESIFERFRQLSGEIKSSTKGVGLGLNIAQELVHLHFGWIDAESEIGRGSAFRFAIPVDDAFSVFSHYLETCRLRSTKPPQVTLMTARLGSSESTAVPDIVLEQIHRLLQHTVRPHDVVLRYGDRQWMLVLNVSEEELSDQRARITQLVQDTLAEFEDKSLHVEFDVEGTWSAVEQQELLEERWNVIVGAQVPVVQL